MKRSLTAWGLAAAGLAAIVACSGSGGSGGGGSGDGGTASGVTFTCTQLGIGCFQRTVPQSDIDSEQSACTGTQGVFAMGPCASTGFAGCCDKGGSDDEIVCYTPTPVTAAYEQECSNGGGTWTAMDAGVMDDGGSGGDGSTGPDAFVGTWLRGGTQTVTCPSSNPVTTNLSGDLVIALGSASDEITATSPDGCPTQYTVSSGVATATVGQTCNTTTEAGVAETITVVSHTFVLSADGQSLTSTASATLDKTATGTMCTLTSSGTFTKQ